MSFVFCLFSTTRDGYGFGWGAHVREGNLYRVVYSFTTSEQSVLAYFVTI